MRISWRIAGVVLAVWSTWNVFANAQPLPPPPRPPLAEGSTDVSYPPGATGDAAVVLELVVEKDGSVSTAVIIEGDEPFAEHARRAVMAWRFVPAQRGDSPVAARIRARVAFHRDPEEPTVGSTARPIAQEGSAPARTELLPDEAGAPPPPVEVTIVGARREIGETTLSASDVREMPGAFGDAFRAIEALPGVTPLVSGIPYFYVRGAPPNNVGYYFDGIRIPLLFHLGLAQSVLHPGLVDHVDFFPSVAPARYGASAGGIMAGQAREPTLALRGEANVRLVDAGALVESPFGEGKGTALVAGRYGYPGPILNAVNPDMQIGYWDYQTRATWQLTPRDRVGLFAFGSHDHLATRSPSKDPAASQEFREQFVSDFHRLDLRYDRALIDGRLRLAVTGGYDVQGATPTYLTNTSFAPRFEIEQRLSDTVRIRGGAYGRFDRYRIKLTAQGPGEPVVPADANPPPTNLSAGAHTDVVWRVSPRVEIVPGARIDVFSSSRANEAPSSGRTKTTLPAFDPRLSTRVTLAPSVAWLSTFGLSHQYPVLRLGDVPAPLVSVPGFPFGHRQLQTAAQLSQGFEVALPAEVVLTATGFYSRFWGLTDLSSSCFQDLPGSGGPRMPDDPVPPMICPNHAPVHGRAYGLELLLRRPLAKRLAGWLSYTLSRATREAHFTTPSGGDDVAKVPSEFDRTHVLNAVLGYDLGRRWRAGGRFLFYTGTPYSQLHGTFQVPPYHAYRTPVFFRVDFRIEKRWPIGEMGSIAFVLEVQNVTLSKEVTGLGLDCEGNGTAQGETNQCEQSKIGPLTIPSVGVEAFF
jgi:hypothetical protein